jgi:hypothetical protein
MAFRNSFSGFALTASLAVAHPRRAWAMPNSSSNSSIAILPELADEHSKPRESNGVNSHKPNKANICSHSSFTWLSQVLGSASQLSSNRHVLFSRLLCKKGIKLKLVQGCLGVREAMPALAFLILLSPCPHGSRHCQPFPTQSQPHKELEGHSWLCEYG